ncbi:bifunctional endo-1,4-beta-xylanase XylA-like [Zeugodacus cucurbitae]|uniref:bifunctional endo-1,4-beta-xylanase XylA-like n=1 Tax=Zeugodacus cucurbitae TaxID=28588 RepID=UPI00059679AB|nr:bifunctional endo-1,4-beta-xylanase XylA-like [Zeugodacus cucurbitae]
MKFERDFNILLALLCVCLIYQIDGVPQRGFRIPQQRHNATAWNNNWRQNTTQLSPNWQGNNQTIGNRNYSNPNNIYNNWQPQGERLWLNNNQSHPHIQVPGFRSGLHYAAAKQSNRSIPVRTGWQQAQSVGPYPTNWAPQRSNSTQNIPNRTQFAPTNSGWLAPGNPTTNYTHGRGGISNSTVNGNRGLPAQVYNGANSYPNWHAGLPGSALVAGTYNGNSLPVSNSGQQGWQTANRSGAAFGFNSGPQLAPLAGSASGHQNAVNAGWNAPSGQPNGAYSAHPYGKLFA